MKYEIYINGKCIKSSDRVIPIFDFLLDYCNSRLKSVSYRTDDNGNYQIYLETR